MMADTFFKIYVHQYLNKLILCHFIENKYITCFTLKTITPYFLLNAC